MTFGARVVVQQGRGGDRAFLRHILGFVPVDAGHGWLIFALPPGEMAGHPAEENDRQEPYFMCNDLRAEISALAEQGCPVPGSAGSEMGFNRQDPTAMNVLSD